MNGCAQHTYFIYWEASAQLSLKSKANREEQDGKSTQSIQNTSYTPRISHMHGLLTETIVHVSVCIRIWATKWSCIVGKKVNERMATVRASAKKERDNRTKAKHVLHLIPMKETLVSLSTGKLCRFCCYFFSPSSSCTCVCARTLQSKRDGEEKTR